MIRLAAGAVGLAALSLLGPAQPSYDAWAWLLWGREVAALDLSTAEGPAFKPLPVLVTTVLAPLGELAPSLWLVVARAGALAAVALAARLAWRLAPPHTRGLAAAVAALGVALTAGWPWHAAVGHGEGLLLALVLGAADRALDGRHRAALALGAGAALLRPESWPFLALYALWARPLPLRALLAAGAAVLLLWFGPELWGSGDPLRSGARARVPNAGQPATEAVPALASLRAALALPFWPLAALALLAPRGPARLAAAAAAAWVALVALMAQAGFSGELRYLLPGAALLAVAAGAGAARAPRAALAVAAAAALALLPGRLEGHGAELARAADEAELYASLDEAVAAAGGAARLRACGPVGTGRFRGPAVAWALGVHKAQVRTPATGDVTLRSRLRRDGAVQPAARGPALARSARWEVRAVRCP